MTWYASHVYVEPKEKALSLLSADTTLSRGLYLVEDLRGHPWPKDEYRHLMPEGGLVVVREFSVPGTPEAEWHTRRRYPVIPFADLTGPDDTKVVQPPALPVLAFGKIYPEKGSISYPPAGFLRFLKALSQAAEAVVSYYHHETAAEWAVEQEFAWVFGEEDEVYVKHVGEWYRIVRYTWDGVSEVSTANPDGVLRYVLWHYGLDLSARRYFAPHTRHFDWIHHKVRSSL